MLALYLDSVAVRPSVGGASRLLLLVHNGRVGPPAGILLTGCLRFFCQSLNSLTYPAKTLCFLTRGKI